MITENVTFGPFTKVLDLGAFAYYDGYQNVFQEVGGNAISASEGSEVSEYGSIFNGRGTETTVNNPILNIENATEFNLGASVFANYRGNDKAISVSADQVNVYSLLFTGNRTKAPFISITGGDSFDDNSDIRRKSEITNVRIVENIVDASSYIEVITTDDDNAHVAFYHNTIVNNETADGTGTDYIFDTTQIGSQTSVTFTSNTIQNNDVNSSIISGEGERNVSFSYNTLFENGLLENDRETLDDAQNRICDAFSDRDELNLYDYDEGILDFDAYLPFEDTACVIDNANPDGAYADFSQSTNDIGYTGGRNSTYLTDLDAIRDKLWDTIFDFSY